MSKLRRARGGNSGPENDLNTGPQGRERRSNVFEQLGNRALNDNVKAKLPDSGLQTTLLDAAEQDQQQGGQELSEDEEILAMTGAISNQDIIYEQLAHNAAYGKIDPVSLQQWGLELLDVYEDSASGLRMVSFKPLQADLSKFPNLQRALAQQHGGKAARPVVAFRGTASMGGIMDDLNEQGIGAFQYSSNEADIVSMLSAAGAFGKVDVCGHSLGGALAQLAAARNPGSIGRIVTFQSPGISAKDAKKIDDYNKSADPKDRITSTHIRVKEDLVPLGGEALTNGTVYTFDREDDWALSAHGAAPLAELNALRGGGVARTFNKDAYDKRRKGKKLSKASDDAELEESTLDGVTVESSREANRDKKSFGERARVGFGSFVDKVGGVFNRKTDSRDDYVETWDEVKAMLESGADAAQLLEHIEQADDLLDEQRTRMRDQLVRLIGLRAGGN